MAKTFIGVREVDEEIFKKFRARAIEKKLRLGNAITLAMQKWLEDKKQKDKEKLKGVKELLKVKPFDFGLGNERLSTQIDEILYGSEEWFFLTLVL